MFACNVEAVEATARQLGRVFDELSNFDSRDDAHTADLSSSPIRNALQDFYDDSSDQRDKIKDSVKGLRDMLQALAQGVRDIDTTLAGALEEGAGDGATAPVPADRAGVQ